MASKPTPAKTPKPAAPKPPVVRSANSRAMKAVGPNDHKWGR